jgi:hypothetical protein
MLTQADALLADLLALRAIEERNKASAAALELFYRLTETVLQRDVLRRSVQEADLAIADHRQLRQQGVPLPGDDSALQRQRLELLGRQVELDASAEEIEGHLCRLLRVPYAPQAPLSPVANLSIDVAPMAVDASVNESLAMRADLAGIGLLSGNVAENSLATVRHAMQPMGGLLGTATPKPRKLFRTADPQQVAAEQQTRKLQLELLLDDQNRAAEIEIRQAAREVATRLQTAALAKQKRGIWQSHLMGLREKHGTGQATAFDIHTAELQSLQAESEAVSALVAWKIAQIKLKQVQGLLAQECGYRLPERCRRTCVCCRGDRQDR